MKRHSQYSARIGVLAIACLLSCKGSCPVPPNCTLEPESGVCLAAFKRYYYDNKEKKCKAFTWGGCGGVVPFETLEACRDCECGK
jgi:hypothetical protein